MIAEIITTGLDDVKTLATADWPNIPRVGETLVLQGAAFGEGDGSLEEPWRNATRFEVVDVIWTAASNESLPKFGREDVEVQVYVLPHREDQGFEAVCTCGPDRCIPKKDDPRHCDDCNGKLGWRHREAFRNATTA